MRVGDVEMEEKSKTSQECKMDGHEKGDETEERRERPAGFLG